MMKDDETILTNLTSQVDETFEPLAQVAHDLVADALVASSHNCDPLKCCHFVVVVVVVVYVFLLCEETFKNK